MGNLERAVGEGDDTSYSGKDCRLPQNLSLRSFPRKRDHSKSYGTGFRGMKVYEDIRSERLKGTVTDGESYSLDRPVRTRWAFISEAVRALALTAAQGLIRESCPGVAQGCSSLEMDIGADRKALHACLHEENSERALSLSLGSWLRALCNCTSAQLAPAPTPPPGPPRVCSRERSR